MSEGRRVLVVDDQVDATRLVEMLLTSRGHEVRVAFDGPGALEVAREFAPEVVFCDIGLPGMDGLEVARRLRAEHAGRAMTLVALTGYGHATIKHDALDAGFDHHVLKPIELDALEEMLVRFVEGGAVGA